MEELQVREEIAVPATFVTGTGDFAVTVGDDSFAEHGILTDDTLVIAGGADSVRAGALVLGAVGDDEVVLRRFGATDVAPSTASVGPTGAGPRSFRVLGEVAGLLRGYR